MLFFFFKQKTAYEMRISDWSSDVCSSDLQRLGTRPRGDGIGKHGETVRRAVGEAAQHAVAVMHLVTQHDGGIELPGHGFLRGRLCARPCRQPEIGRASGRERVCQYV